MSSVGRRRRSGPGPRRSSRQPVTCSAWEMMSTLRRRTTPSSAMTAAGRGTSSASPMWPKLQSLHKVYPMCTRSGSQPLVFSAVKTFRALNPGPVTTAKCAEAIVTIPDGNTMLRCAEVAGLVLAAMLSSRENLGPVAVNVSQLSSRSTIFVRLHTNGHQELQYQPGDHLGVFPGNQDDLVNALIERLEDAPPINQLVKVELLEERSTALGSKGTVCSPMPTYQTSLLTPPPASVAILDIPTEELARQRGQCFISVGAGVIRNWTDERRLPPCTIFQAFKYYLDITTPPTPLQLQQFASLATCEKEKQQLLVLSKGLQEYEEWKWNKNPTIVEVLEEFQSIQMPATLLLTQLSLLQPRYYSISSSPTCTPRRCTSPWPSSLTALESTRLPLPQNPQVPCILIGPGTGIAPFRSFWQQRQFDIQHKGMSPCPMILVFGCRQSKVDHIYREETMQAQSSGVFRELYTAYSREPDKPKKYVQDILQEKLAEPVYQALKEQGGHIYVCGDVTMAADVLKAIQRIVAQQGKLSVEDAGVFISRLRDDNRYHEDIFGVTLRTYEVTNRLRSESIAFIEESKKDTDE
ncbi:hypothetical protein QTO34_012259 [Cnephaeus nilssonii]|uniref:nitric-oxide synthase (NADPH) n=1 Tax=Cnephaeus nilssonii TaxID=3371016 RepID=A0AA40HCL1_CNENI|nr:hypothetical protein QTO34_012259 [Eptesicus nilssonii]